MSNLMRNPISDPPGMSFKQYQNQVNFKAIGKSIFHPPTH